MKYYEKECLKSKGYDCIYLEYTAADSLRALLKSRKIKKLHVLEIHDDYLSKWLRKVSDFKVHKSNYFFSDFDWIKDTLGQQKNYYLTSFYKSARRQNNILICNGNPIGGKWTYDSLNRKKTAKDYQEKPTPHPNKSNYVNEARAYIEKHFKSNPGDSSGFFYSVTHQQAKDALKLFLESKLTKFGDFQDAFDANLNFLEHSLLSPYLNTGLLTPKQVIENALYADAPINSVEGFIRQIIGWRDFFGGIYEISGVEQRNLNFFDHYNDIPLSFWNSTTQIPPVDAAIARTLEHSYTHHIERLMVLGNFMLLCEFHPHQVYKWFMELFIDAYDWVMVPNVYGMSQYADGGLITTKPYLSSSNYIRKMSHYKSGDWCDTWDGLYWRFIKKHKKFFEKNPRLSIMTKQLERMGPSKLKKHEANADKYLTSHL